MLTSLIASVLTASVISKPIDTPRFIVAYKFAGEQSGSVLPPDQMARRISERYEIPIFENFEKVGSFWTECKPEQLTAMQGDPDIVAITEDNEVFLTQASQTRQTPTPFFAGSTRGTKWALDRLDQFAWQKTATDPLSSTIPSTLGGTATSDNTASGIDVYVIDYPLQPSNSDLVGRVVVPAGTQTQYQNFHHGTQVASIIGGSTVGVAPGARLHTISVATQGSIFLNAVINSMNWVARNGTPGKSVINLSIDTWNGPRSSEWFAVQRLVAQNFVVVTAAGNGHQNASTNGLCHPRAIVAGGSTFDDDFWLGSKWGNMIDFLAPSEKVCAMASHWQGNDTYLSGHVFPDGTSYASAYVAGVAAQALSNYWRMTRPGVNDNPVRWNCRPGIRRPRTMRAADWCKDVMWRYSLKGVLKSPRIVARPGTPNTLVQFVPYFKLRTGV